MPAGSIAGMAAWDTFFRIVTSPSCVRRNPTSSSSFVTSISIRYEPGSSRRGPSSRATRTRAIRRSSGLILELAALSLATSYLFEIVDTLARRALLQHRGDPGYLPKVAIQVPAYNEPMEVVTETLNSLAAIDYPNLIVQVVDNNTPDEANWRALEALCKKLGPRFQFMHLENWPGYKAGALNEANRRLPDDVELVGIVDSDYVVNADWPRAVVDHFSDERVAFVQTPQNYRDWDDDQYLRGLYRSYQYFFEISMPCRQNRNAIIFAGTMGLIRLSVLREIGGWNADIVTEDAEASLRMLALGYIGVYEPRPFGAGLMPAMLASTSTRPNCSSTRANAASTCSRLLTSHSSASPPPMSETVFSAAPTRTSRATT